MDISIMTTYELKNEIARREVEEKEKLKPKVLNNEDLNPAELIAVCKEHVDDLIEYGPDSKQWVYRNDIYKEAMKFIYGSDIYKWVNDQY